jgi:soluble cytochrome b562
MPPELFPRPAFSLTPEPGRTGPKLWVRRVVIWREPNVVLQDVPLRPGFNVVWSPDSQTPDSPIGHGGGKTTFCRLFRFCLGEDTFAPDDLRRRIGEVFPKGWVGAEIVLDGEVWTVMRSLGYRRRDIVQAGGSLDLAFSEDRKVTGMASLMEAFNRSFMGNIPKLMPSSIGSDGAWKALLAWITRDQECRFSHALNWRSSDSDSSSPVVNRSAEDKLLVVRAAIRGLSRNEVAAQQEEERQRNNVTGKKSHLARLEWQLGRARANLPASLKKHGTAPPGTPIDISLLKKGAADELAKVLKLPEGVNPADVEKVRRNRDSAKEESDRRQAEVKSLSDEIATKDATRSFIAGELPEAHARLVNEKNPVCPICKIPINKALANGCHISTETCDLFSLQKEISRKRDQVSALEREISALRPKVPALQKEAAEYKKAFEELDRALNKVEKSRDASSGSVRAAQRVVEDVDQYEALFANFDRARSAAEKMVDKLEKTRGIIARHRGSSSETITSLSNWFDSVLRELVPGDIRGYAKLDGNGLRLDVELGGYRSTVAIDSLKVVAFDLAILAMSLEHSLFFPGLLIHDSPREADLSETVYSRLFEFSAKLEACGSAPLFQYILTTTTAPPDRFQHEPWLRLKVKGAPAAERLLKVDL